MKIRTSLFCCLLATALALPAAAAEKPAAAPDKSKPSLTDITTKIITASVVAINYDTRAVSLKEQDGNIVNVQVPLDVSNLQQIKVGDEVLSEVIETMAIYARPNDGSKPSRTNSETVQVARPGEKPMKVQVMVEEMVAEVTAVNNDTRQINLKLPNGLLQTYFVPRYFTHLDNVKKGDQLVVRHSKTTVIKVTKVVKPAAAKTAKPGNK